jgi:DNA-binding transcriptional ArsR family regulator
MCQLADQPVLVAVEKIIKALREKGAMNTGELMKASGAAKRTFYRALDTLQEAGIVRKEGEMYSWYEFARARVYESDAEFTLTLNHSRNIASGLNYLMHVRKRSYLVEEGSVSGDKYEEYALVHLRSGYSNLFAVFEKTEAFKSQIEREEKTLKEAIEERLTALSLPTKTLYPKNVATGVCEDIKMALRGHEPGFLTNLRVDAGHVTSGGYTFAGEDVAGQVRDLIQKEEASEENRQTGKKIVEIENRYYTLQQGLQKEIEALIMQVENGTPLQGSCQMCPKVKIATCVP